MPADTVPGMTYTEGLATLNAALCYIEQQPEVMLTDLVV